MWNITDLHILLASVYMKSVGVTDTDGIHSFPEQFSGTIFLFEGDGKATRPRSAVQYEQEQVLSGRRNELE